MGLAVYSPMHLFLSGDNLNPESHKHLNDPSIFMQRPLSHIPFEHSSVSMQNDPSEDRVKPGWQTHLYDPGVFSHRPLRQILGFSRHSSVSAEKFTRQNKVN